MAKYGTFMKSDLFNCKFFMGRMSKQFPEPPLHYIQGKIELQMTVYTILLHYRIQICLKHSFLKKKFLERYCILESFRLND